MMYLVLFASCEKKENPTTYKCLCSRLVTGIQISEGVLEKEDYDPLINCAAAIILNPILTNNQPP